MDPVRQNPAKNKAGDDDLVMSLVEMALARPTEERDGFMESVCEDDSALLAAVRKYVDWEQRMQGFMASPLVPSTFTLEAEHPFNRGDIVLSRFRIVREIARGGMGIVYEAVDEKLDRRVALKCPKSKYRRRLPPEVRIASDLSHPNICKTYDIHETGGLEFLSMEYLEGETLSERLKRKPLAAVETDEVARQLAAGVAAAHRAGVVHGDLKSSNVILTRSADGSLRAVITDFGLARNSVHAPDTSDDAAGGTPAYMAPELWKGAPSAPASDVYALGVILYEMASGGRRPFQSRGLQASGRSTRTMADVSHPGLTWEERLHRKPARLNSKWDGVLGRCLHPLPERRFPSAVALAEALAPSKTRRRVFAAAGAVVLAALTGLGTYYRATLPPESVVLSVLPFESDLSLNSSASAIYQEFNRKVALVQGSKRRSFTALPPGSSRKATHSFTASLRQSGQKIEVRARLADVPSGLARKEWTALYEPGELRYAPVALAGVVTGALELPTLGTPPVNALARADYDAGLHAMRLLSTTDAAMAKLERAVAADPDSALTHAALAQAYWFKYVATRDSTWRDKAQAEARLATLRDPDTPAVHRINGTLLESGVAYEEAIREFQRAIQIDPNDADAHRGLSQAFDSNHQREEAMTEAHRAVELDPSHYRNHQALGGLLYGQARYAEAEAQYRRAVEIAPHESTLLYALGTMLELQGRLPEAEAQLRQALAMGESAQVLETLGFDLVYQSREEEAIPFLERATELRPARAITWIKLGTAYRRAGRAADAKRANSSGLERAEKEVARDPRYGYARGWMAYAQAWLGDFRSAEANLEQALQLSPADQALMVVAAQAYAAMNRYDKAIAVLTGTSKDVLATFHRFPDFPELKQLSRYQQLLKEKQLQ